MQALGRAIAETNREIHRQGEANPEFHAMGTTASVLAILPEGAILGHVGDSRVYRLRGDTLEQLTFDHSLQWELKALGRFHEHSELARSVPKNVITRSLGPGAEVQVDVEGPYPLETGDTFLLCSDGLSGTVEDDEIGALLSCLTPAEAAEVLVDLANLRGGPDNITVVIVRVEDAESMVADGPSASSRASRQAWSPHTLTAWVVAAVCLLLAGLLYWAELAAPAVVSGVAASAALLYGAISLFRGRPVEVPTAAAPQRAGKGPYSSIPCKSRKKSVEMLRGVLAELRQAAEESGWELDWEHFRACERRAEQAAGNGDEDAAIRGCTEAITSTMRQLRQPEDDSSGGSTRGR
jgi:protein phosphatase